MPNLLQEFSDLRHQAKLVKFQGNHQEKLAKLQEINVITQSQRLKIIQGNQSHQEAVVKDLFLLWELAEIQQLLKAGVIIPSDIFTVYNTQAHCDYSIAKQKLLLNSEVAAAHATLETTASLSTPTAASVTSVLPLSSSAGASSAAGEVSVDTEEAVKTKSNTAVVHYNRGLAFYEVDGYVQAINCFDAALKIDAKYILAHNMKAAALDELGNYEAAIISCDQALKIDPNNKDSWNTKGLALDHLNRYTEAIDCYNRGMKSGPSYEFLINNKGDALNNFGRYSEAIVCFDEVLKGNPKCIFSINGKGNSFYYLNRWAEAQNCFEYVLQLVSLSSELDKFSKYKKTHPKYLLPEEGKQLAQQQQHKFEKADQKELEAELKAAKEKAEKDKAEQKKLIAAKNEELTNLRMQLEQLKLQKQNAVLAANDISVSFVIPYDQLEYGEQLGSGGFGVVYKGTWQHLEVAIKELPDSNPSENAIKDFKNEMQVMAKLRSPYVVQLYGCVLGNPKYCMVMEYMPKGSLFHLLHSQQTLNWDVRYKMSLNIAYGLAFLHSQHITHCDLKSPNVLVANSDTGEVKLTDFGLSQIKTQTKTKTKTNTKNSSVGSFGWMAPELTKAHAKYTQECDMFSFGMTLWEIASRKVPFEDAQVRDLIPIWIAKGDREKIPADCPAKIANLINECWSADPAKRPTAAKVVDFLRSDANEFNVVAKPNTNSTATASAEQFVVSYQPNSVAPHKNVQAANTFLAAPNKIDDAKQNKLNTAVIQSILNDIAEYKKTATYDRHISLEMLGFALALSQELKDEAAKKMIAVQITNELENFLFKGVGVKQNTELANLFSNLDGFKKAINLIRLKCQKNISVNVQQEFERWINSIFEYVHGLLQGPPKGCQYALMSVGSLAMQRVTPYSDIEYIILVNQQQDSYRTYFNNFADLFNLIMISFGESPLTQSAALLEKYKVYFQYLKKGVRLEGTNPTLINRRIGLINTPQELLTLLPDKIMHENGNYTTGALLTVRSLQTNTPDLPIQYQTYLNKFLSTQNYIKCLNDLITDCNRKRENFVTDLETAELENDNDKQIELKQILMPFVNLPRLLLVFLKATVPTKFNLAATIADILLQLKRQQIITELQSAKWLGFLNKLDALRLTLQLKNNAAEAKISLAELRKQFVIDDVINHLKELGQVVEVTLAKHNTAEVINALPKLQDLWQQSGNAVVNDAKAEPAQLHTDDQKNVPLAKVITGNSDQKVAEQTLPTSQALIDAEAALKIHPNSAEAHYKKGLALYGLGRYFNAIDCFDAALKIDPQYILAYNNKGLSYDALGNYEQAVVNYNAALDVDLDNPVLHYNKGLALHGLGRYEDAIRCFNTVLKNDSILYVVCANNAKGNSLCHMNRWNEAENCFRAALEFGPDSFPCFFNILNNKPNNSKEYENALKILEHSKKTHPQYLLPRQGLELSKQRQPISGRIYIGHENFYAPLLGTAITIQYQDQQSSAQMQALADAIVALKNVIPSAVKYYNKGLALYDLGCYFDAIVCFDEALKINPQYIDAYDFQGLCFEALGNYEQAIACYNNGLEIDPKNIVLHRHKGLALRGCSRHSEAIACFDKALTDDPTAKAYIYNNKGNSFCHLNRWAEAEECFERVLQLSHPNPVLDGLNRYKKLHPEYLLPLEGKQLAQQFKSQQETQKKTEIDLKVAQEKTDNNFQQKLPADDQKVVALAKVITDSSIDKDQKSAAKIAVVNSTDKLGPPPSYKDDDYIAPPLAFDSVTSAQSSVFRKGFGFYAEPAAGVTPYLVQVVPVATAMNVVAVSQVAQLQATNQQILQPVMQQVVNLPAGTVISPQRFNAPQNQAQVKIAEKTDLEVSITKYKQGLTTTDQKSAFDRIIEKLATITKPEDQLIALVKIHNDFYAEESKKLKFFSSASNCVFKLLRKWLKSEDAVILLKKYGYKVVKSKNNLMLEPTLKPVMGAKVKTVLSP